jgi:hypothetical protein
MTKYIETAVVAKLNLLSASESIIVEIVGLFSVMTALLGHFNFHLTRNQHVFVIPVIRN